MSKLLSGKTEGVFAISVTPFNEQGDIDWESLDRVTDHYLAKGANGLTILGVMGEAPKMTQSESKKIAERVIKRAGDVPVAVGVSAPGLAPIRELTEAVMDLGAAGVMVAPPGSLKTDPQIIDYYGEVAFAIGRDVPIILQDFPLTTGVKLSMPALAKIVENVPSVVMLKHEDWPGLDKISGIRKAEGDGRRRISILCGNGAVLLPQEVERGADGAMTGFAYTEMLVDVVSRVKQGEIDRANDIFDAHLALVCYEQQPGAGLAVRKYVLHKLGAIASPALRRPGGGVSAATAAELDRLMDRRNKRMKELG